MNTDIEKELSAHRNLLSELKSNAYDIEKQISLEERTIESLEWVLSVHESDDK